MHHVHKPYALRAQVRRLLVHQVHRFSLTYAPRAQVVAFFGPLLVHHVHTLKVFTSQCSHFLLAFLLSALVLESLLLMLGGPRRQKKPAGFRPRSPALQTC